jgi:hypothetical protein
MSVKLVSKAETTFCDVARLYSEWIPQKKKDFMKWTELIWHRMKYRVVLL